MRVRELIALLQQMPPNLPVTMHWDGEPRSNVEAVWETKGGTVSLGWLTEPVYSDEGRSLEADSEKPGIYIQVEDMPGILKGEPGDDT